MKLRVARLIVLGLIFFVTIGCKKSSDVDKNEAKLKSSASKDPIVALGVEEGHRQATMIDSASRLKKISGALLVWAADHGGKHLLGPGSLTDLLKDEMVTADDLVCPTPGCEYVYLGYHSTAEPSDVIIYEHKIDGPTDESNFLCGDGHVELLVGADKIAEAVKAKVIPKSD